MSKEEEVKNILENRQVYRLIVNKSVREVDIESLAKEICQLFAPKSDEGRLLTEVEELIKRACDKYDDAHNKELLIEVHAREILSLTAQHYEAMRPKIICLCGSTRFKEAFFSEYARLSDEGYIVLTVNRLVPQHDGLTPEQEKQAHKLHLQKIEVADELFILNVGGYIGETLTEEIAYALKIGKPIKYLEALKAKKE